MVLRGVARISLLVVATLCVGCSWIVNPSVRSGWCDRLAAAERNLDVERLEIEADGEGARKNQIEFINVLSAGDPAYAQSEAEEDRGQVLEWSRGQSEATARLSDIEQDIEALRQEIEEEAQ